MSSHPFTCPSLQRIWGSPDAILLIFAGGAAEFAAIKAVDWLFFTNALPADPIGRFFDTVRYAQHVFFSSYDEANAALNKVNRIHHAVETARKTTIPDWAYRDVLFLLIDYGERAHTIVYGPMTAADREIHFNTLITLGHAMHLTGLPTTYEEYKAQRHQQLLADYAHSALTDRLNAAYRNSVGPVRYGLLQLLQGCLLPVELQSVTGLQPHPIIAGLLWFYRYLPGGGNKLRWLQPLLLPAPYASQLRHLGR
ncbi:MAG: DUF2236 domain-containing protein [Caldilinea sp. CFX5]|nr:DUF2236 domain-containing protein [Caldilinea sp. CFX5]